MKQGITRIPHIQHFNYKQKLKTSLSLLHSCFYGNSVAVQDYFCLEMHVQTD